MELAEARTTAARQKADKVAVVAAARVSDLDQEETPESIMLSSMTEEVAKDRTDREVVVPWLKFLWESYRAILELLYKIPKLEKAYHNFCERAFKFCLDYSRIMEFKRLCDMLRMQLTNLQKTPAASARVRTVWEWTPEAVELHLKTRFAQLEAATSLELWNEGFRTVEDIYGIMVASKKTPKAKLMMAYYDKLQRIFWVSDNKLFHAYAWFRYYSLCCEVRSKDAEKSVLASSVLLSALTVPSTRDMYSFGDEEEEVVEKSSQMALLLDFQTNPSRQSLLSEIAAKGFLNDVLPELSALYDNLEVKFQPLTLVKKITAAVAAVRAHPALSMYAAPLQRVAVIKLMQQLGRVYSTIKLDFLYKLLADMGDLSPTAIERILIEGVAAKQLQLRIHHASRCIYFTAPGGASATGLDSQVATFGSQLNKVSQSISLLLGQQTLETQKAAARKAFLTKVADASEEEYVGSLDRKAQIERRKEEMERVQQERQKEEARLKEEMEASRKVDEARRLQQEEEERIAEKNRKAREKMEIMRVQKELEKHGVFMDEAALAELDYSARRELISEAQNETQKAKDADAQKLVDQARRLDHITRALRIEAAAKIVKCYENQLLEDESNYAAYVKSFYEAAKAQHEADLAQKKRFSHMLAVRGAFESKIVPQQKAVYDRHVAKEKQKAMKHRVDQAIAKARRLAYDAQELAEAEEERERERQAKEEQARIDLEEHERLRVVRERAEAAEKEREERAAKEKQDREEAERLRREEEDKLPPKPAAYAPPGARAAMAEAAGGERWDRSGDRRTEGRPMGGDRWGGGDRDPRDRDAGGAGWGRGGSGSGPRGPPGRDHRDPRDARDSGRDGGNNDFGYDYFSVLFTCLLFLTDFYIFL